MKCIDNQHKVFIYSFMKSIVHSYNHVRLVVFVGAIFFLLVAQVVLHITRNNVIVRQQFQLNETDETIYIKYGSAVKVSNTTELHKIDKPIKNIDSVFNAPTEILATKAFPSIDERIGLYARGWYNPPCKELTKENRIIVQRSKNSSIVLGIPQLDHYNSIEISNEVVLDSVFAVHPQKIYKCAKNTSHFATTYCNDVLKTLLPAFVNSAQERLQQQNYTWKIPLLVQFGDSDESKLQTKLAAALPHFHKFRRAHMNLAQIDNNNIRDFDKSDSTNDLACKRSSNLPREPIIWNLNVERHYGLLQKVPKYDLPWNAKLNQSIFWGAPTGILSTSLLKTDNIIYSNVSSLSPRETCRAIPRCRLVYDTAMSKTSLVRAKLVRTRDRFPDVIDGVELTGGRISLQEQLQYKGIIVVEGNDVASNLKWALYSRTSVVLMVYPPTFTSYAMEESLKPWVHFVPLKPDLSNVAEQTQWMLDHPVQAQIIAQNGHEWIHQLWFDNKAKRDNPKIEKKLMQRYLAHFDIAAR